MDMKANEKVTESNEKNVSGYKRKNRTIFPLVVPLRLIVVSIETFIIVFSKSTHRGCILAKQRGKLTTQKYPERKDSLC